MTKVGRESCFTKQFEMDVSKGKVDMTFRGKLGLLLLRFATCSEKPLFQQWFKCLLTLISRRTILPVTKT